MDQPGDTRGFIGLSLSRAWVDTVALHWVRTVMAVATSVVAAIILFIATGNPSSWLAVLAAPIVLALTYIVFLILNLFGWNRQWLSRWSVEAAGPRLVLYLKPKDPTVKWQGPNYDCWVRPPNGRVPRHQDVGRSMRGQFWAMYPDDFGEAPPLASGTYRVTWLEEIRPGKWREILRHRVDVTLPAPGMNGH